MKLNEIKIENQVKYHVFHRVVVVQDRLRRVLEVVAVAEGVVVAVVDVAAVVEHLVLVLRSGAVAVGLVERTHQISRWDGYHQTGKEVQERGKDQV